MGSVADVLGGGVPLFDLTGNNEDASGDPVSAALSKFTQVNQRSFSSGLVEKIFPATNRETQITLALFLENCFDKNKEQICWNING